MIKSHSTIGSFCSRVSHTKPLTRCQPYLSAKTAIAAGVAWAVAQAVEPHGRPYFAPIAVVIIVQPTTSDSLSRALQRVVGVILGVAVALSVSHFLGPTAWSIGLIVFAGLVLGRTFRLGSQGVSQVCVTALLVFLLGRITPGYGGERIVETAIGAAVAVLAVLFIPSAPTLAVALSEALAPLDRCGDCLRSIGEGVARERTRDQAVSWRQEARRLTEAIDAARVNHERYQLDARWNLRARGRREMLDRSEEVLRVAERIVTYVRSIARALADGSMDAQPMPGVSAVLVGTASAIDAFVTRAVGDQATQLRILSETVRSLGDSSDWVVSDSQWSSGIGASSWPALGAVFTMNHWILIELGRASERHGNATRDVAGRHGTTAATV
jgi:uncharacterized membrane protein YgaE (UPF0421/DUF939 family)